MKFFILAISLFCFGSSAIAHRETSDSSFSNAGSDRLSQVEAIERAAQVEKVDYTLSFRFAKGAENFSGRASIAAKLKRTDLPLRVDFWGKSVDEIRVNGVKVSAPWENGFILIPASALSSSVKIEIEYTGRFSPGMDGIFKVTDAADGEEYIYTNLEPYGAHRVFPCFDQPDLKATYQVQVEKPADWKAITNTPALDKAGTQFARTLSFSTYLFFLGAGPYAVWNDSHKGLPLAIYARKALAPHVDAKNLFTLTKKGLDFFQGYFDSAYPFPKYDHIFAPELGNGAMENPGAVTMNERMIFVGEVNPSQVQGRANTLLHEMAHMWFGDLVTMKWWNDLWLNESFATYMASVAYDRALGQPKAAWQEFAGDKGWAYWQDQLSTTHPIVVEVEDTDKSDTIFDGITYGKGAATMKQLHYFVGEAGFRDGLRAYFKKHSWKNTEVKDFVAEIALASGKDLNAWTAGWLHTAGPSRVVSDWACENGKISRFRILQERKEGNLPHKTKIGFFKKSGRMKKIFELEAAYDGAVTELPAALGLACPDFVYPNVDDQDYALFALDPVSLGNLGKDVGQFEDPFVRQMLWSTLVQMVKEQKLKVSDFLEITTEALADENDVGILSMLITRHGGVRNNLPTLTPTLLPTVGARLEAATWAAANDNRKNKGVSLLWLEQYVAVAHTAEGAKNLKALLSGERLNQENRWLALQQLAKIGDLDAPLLIGEEKKKDGSNFAKSYGYGAEVGIASLENKQNHWAALTDFTNELSYPLREAGARNFHSEYRPDLSEAFVDRYFAFLQQVNWERDSYLGEIVMELFPVRLCTPKLLERSRAELEASSMPETAKRYWIETNDMLEECVKSRALEN